MAFYKRTSLNFCICFIHLYHFFLVVHEHRTLILLTLPIGLNYSHWLCFEFAGCEASMNWLWWLFLKLFIISNWLRLCHVDPFHMNFEGAWHGLDVCIWKIALRVLRLVAWLPCASEDSSQVTSSVFGPRFRFFNDNFVTFDNLRHLIFLFDHAEPLCQW